MAAGRLYPPIVDYSMPAFALEGDNPKVKIYFALPSYISASEAKMVHMTVRYLESNANALSGGYPAKIKVSSIQLDEDRVTRVDRYFVELLSSDLKDGFTTGTIYKVQLRFSSIDPGLSGPTAAWFNENYADFSEWSTVALIRPITKPEYTILGLEDADKGAAVNYASVDSVFTITYSQGDSSEPLKQWRTRLYDASKTTLLADSGMVTYSNYDYLPVDDTESVAFDSILPYQMEVGTQYILQLDLVTRNGYETGSDFVFACYPSSGTDFEGSVDMWINEEEAYAEVIVSSDQINVTNNLVIRRSSSESNFTIWEDVAVKTFNNEAVNWVFQDFTIESGIWYRYGVQTRDIRGHRGALTKLSPIQMGEFEDAFLYEAGGRQLKLRYNFQISSANITVAETKTDTMGSKFPFVRRNGNMYYRTFQCTGLITGYMDQNAHLFTTKAELYHNEDARYKTVRDPVDYVVNSYDYTYEREFREKVQEFLYDDKIKLYKSLTEGNMLIKLMNISLTPKNELGRLLYSFTAQAVEIDEPTISNLDAYGLQTIGVYSNAINYSESRVGQLSNYGGINDTTGEVVYKTFPANQNIITEISKQYGWKYNASEEFLRKDALNNIVTNDFQLIHLRIEFESDPYLIERNGTTLTPFTGKDTTGKDLILGWLLSIDGQTILVQPPNHIYELKEDDLIISSTSVIMPLADCQMNIYFGIQLDEELDVSLTPISTTFYQINGQLYRIFKPDQVGENVINLLTNKYSISNDDMTEVYEFDALFSADIEAEPGTIIYARSSATNEDTKFVMNKTGNLLLEPGISGIKINSLHFEGRQFDIRYLDPLYYWDGIHNYNEKECVQHFLDKYDNGTSQPATAQDYDFYLGTKDDQPQLYMFFNREWRECTKVSDVIYEIKCPVTAIVNYSIQQRKGVYQRN